MPVTGTRERPFGKANIVTIARNNPFMQVAFLIMQIMYKKKRICNRKTAKKSIKDRKEIKITTFPSALLPPIIIIIKCPKPAINTTHQNHSLPPSTAAVRS
jgi:hypothetical protein